MKLCPQHCCEEAHPSIPMETEEESCITWSKLILSSQISWWLHGQLQVLSPLQQIPLASIKGPELGKPCSPFG